jgi:hypothetical protein
MPQIGAIDATMGTNTPINNPPITDPNVGVTLYEYPKNYLNRPETNPKVKLAKGKAIILERKTYLKEENMRLMTTNFLSAPIVFSNAKSKLFLSVPVSIMLFIIRTLSTNRLMMIILRMTPINIPK